LELPQHLQRRVSIDRVSPEVDCGRFPVKQILGETIDVEADIVCDGHDELECRLLVRHGAFGQWHVVPMTCQGNDRWKGSFQVDRTGCWHYDIAARVDTFATWRRDLRKRHEAGEAVTVELATGSELIREATHRANPTAAVEMNTLATALLSDATLTTAESPRLAELMALHADRRNETKLDPPRPVWVDRSLARTSSWYELFPRSWSTSPGRHATFREVAERLDYVQKLGFDIVYLPPIHPIGTSFRKGPNNSLKASPTDVGSPWAIGSSEGGHTAIHPQLGSFEDFDFLRRRAESLGLELALDLALQCSPDHPWVREHPEWFQWRSDGTIRYAENPPKKYQDIVPLDFGCDAWRSLWQAIEEVVRFWVDRGVKIFRVDNPHTKPFAFWEWLLSSIHRTHPEVLFLSEAFTRPKVMYRLAKLGFTQSYTYFTWRVEKEELAEYFEEITQPPVANFFRPNFWPNTPDILHATLQEGGRPMFITRLVLAAMSVGNWGIYGPAFELQEAEPFEAGSEEYLNSEKYEIKSWKLDSPESLAPLIQQINTLRHNEPALATAASPRIEQIDHPQLLAWSKHDHASGNRLVVIVNLQPNEAASGPLTLDLERLGIAPDEAITALDLLGNDSEDWSDGDIRVTLGPDRPAAIYRLTSTPAEVLELGCS
jgi:starch synthase (maltosyl-transferring)